MPLNHDDIRKVAMLSRLELTEDEIAAQLGPLNDLLAQFAILKQVDTQGVEPTSHPFSLVNVLRDDIEKPSLTREQVLANAPEARDGCFVVPRILAE